MRRIGCNREAISNVLAYLISFTIAASVMTSSVLITTNIIDDKTTSVAEVEAQSLANKVADALVEAIESKQSMPEAAYQKTLDIPRDLAGKSYYIETTSTRVYVNTTDGAVSKSSTTYSAEDLNIGISGKVYSGSSKLDLLSDKSDFVYKLDFGTGNSTSHSPVESGYYMVSNRSTITQSLRDPPWWDSSYRYRIPIKVKNDASEELEEVPVKIVLDTTNFDYSHANVNVTSSSTVSSDLVFIDSEYGVVAEVEINPDTWYTWWIKGYLVGDIQIEVTIIELSEGYDLDDIDGDSIKLNGVSCKSWDGNTAIFDPQEALLSLGDDPTPGKYTITISGLLYDWTPFYGWDVVTVALADIFVDDDADPGWYDATHVKTVQEGVNNASADDAVFVYAGTYDENVVINKKVNLLGEDKDTTIIDGLDGDAGGDVVDVNVNDVYIDSFSICGGDGGTYEGDGIYLDGDTGDYRTGITIRNCDVYNNELNGIKLFKADENTIINCDVYQNGFETARNGICLDMSSSNNIINCHVHHQEGDGHPGEDEYPDGIDIRTNSNYNLIENCNVHDMTDDGIDFDYLSDHNTARNCSVYNNGARGIQFQQDEGYNTITNCSVYSNNQEGIVSYESNYNTIENCEVYQNVREGIWFVATLTTNCKGNKITNCNIYENGNNGVTFEHADDNTISNCNIFENGYSTDKNGIYFWKSGINGQPNYITHCNIYNNAIDGIIFHGSKYNSIEYCNVFDNGDDGIHLTDAATIDSNYNTIRYCNFYGNGGGSGGGVGVWIDGGIVAGSRHNEIHYNNFAEQKNTMWSPYVYNAWEGNPPLYLYHPQNDWDGNYWDDYTGGEHHVIPPNPGNTDNNPRGDPYHLPAYIQVDDDASSSWYDDYHVKTIQEGIDYVHHGGSSPYTSRWGTVKIHAGTYNNANGDSFPIQVDKSKVKLIGISESGMEVIVDPSDGGTEDIFVVNNADDVKISGLTIKDGTSGIKLASVYSISITDCKLQENDYGVYLDSADYNAIRDCYIHENDYGVYDVNSGGYNNIVNCTISENDYGVYIDDSIRDAIEHCSINSNTQYGIYIIDSSLFWLNNDIISCDITSNSNGIYIEMSDNTYIKDCDIYSNTQYGIHVKNGGYNDITYCDIYSNDDHGIYLDSTEHNDITYCDIYSNDDGIYITGSSTQNDIENCNIYLNTQHGIYISDSSNNNRIVDRNNICDNDYGIYISGSSNNKIHHNNFENNNYSAYDNGDNKWDNDYDIPFDPLTDDGGNHWDNYDEGYEGAYDFYSGPNQDQPGSDGIVDTPYNISGGSNQDRYPFGGGKREVKPYYIDYWNPYGKSIILVNMSLKSHTFKYIYLYYGYDEPLNDFHNHTIEEVSLFFDDFNSDFVETDKWDKPWGQPWPDRDDGNIIIPDHDLIYTKDYEIPENEDPQPIAYSKTTSESMYIVEAGIKINDGQGNMFFLAGPPMIYYYDKSYIVSANVTPVSDLTLNKHYCEGGPQSIELDKDSSVPDLDHWLRMKSYVYLSKRCYMPNDDESNKNTENVTTITGYLYNYDTFADEGNVSGWDTESRLGVPGDPPDQMEGPWFGNPWMHGKIGLGAGLLSSQISNTEVDWVRVMKTPIVPPTVSIGSMESSISNYGWTGTPPSSGNRETFDPFNPGPVLCDFNYGTTPATFVVNLPNGTYTITVTMGDYSGTCDTMEIACAGKTLTIPATEAAGEFETKWFTINWDGGNLNLKFSGTDWAVNSMLIERSYKGIKIE